MHRAETMPCDGTLGEKKGKIRDGRRKKAKRSSNPANLMPGKYRIKLCEDARAILNTSKPSKPKFFSSLGENACS